MSIEEEKKEENELDNNSAPIEEELQKRKIVETIDVAEVDSTLKENNDYFKPDKENPKVTIKNIDQTKITNPEINYLADININDTCRYIGFLTRNLKRMGRGFNIYNTNKYEGTANDEYYYGEWNFLQKEGGSEIGKNNANKESEKNGFGIYQYKNTDENIDNELYIGNWEDGAKKGNGVYIWIKKDNEMKNKFYDCIIGNFGGNGFETLTKGIRLQVFKDLKCSAEDKIVKIAYLSDMDQDGIKTDDHCIIIENDKIFKGEVEKDEIKSGRFVCTKIENSKFIKQKSYNIKLKAINPDEQTEEKFEFDADKNDVLDNELLKLKNTFESNKFYEDLCFYIEKAKNLIENAKNIDYYSNGNFQEDQDLKDSIDKLVEKALKFMENYHVKSG